MAGLWRLTSPKTVLPLLETQAAHGASHQYPMKEFTVYPKRPKPPPSTQQETREYLLMLKEDGSFRQCGKDIIDEANPTLSSRRRNRILAESQQAAAAQEESTVDSVMGVALMKGTWDFLDGKLILAADRPANADVRRVHDTILVGKVVATSEQSLVDNPVVGGNTGVNATATTTVERDTHLSVPKGSVKIGKFMYPKNHPSFFEQPIFKPTPTGSFQLTQVLGSLNAQSHEEEKQIEKFTRQDFYDKRFLLTSHPIEHKPRGHTRWSIKQNKYVVDPPKKSKQQEEDEKNIPIRIRVIEVMFFANNTFSTVAGLGSDAILRGKWDIIGQDRDQLWMQVWRFGFGRSVSGSVYSEGRALSHNDAKTYWGEISYLEASEGNEDQDEHDDRHVVSDELPRLQVKGSVIYGSGLEPQPVARFIMTEAMHVEVYGDEEDESDDDDDDDTTDGTSSPDDNLDWSNAFQ